MQDTIWICKDGRRNLVRRMQRSHIENCIHLIERTGWRREYLMRLKLELMIRDFMGESH